MSEIAPVESTAVEDEARAATQMPKPVGFKMLIGLPTIDNKYDSGIIKAGSVVRNDEIATVVGFVLDMGADCYQDKTRFPSGPLCKKGDFVLLRAYSGTRFKLHDVELRLVNDDAVEAVVEDPRGFSRV